MACTYVYGGVCVVWRTSVSKVYLLNAFSPSMLPDPAVGAEYTVNLAPVSPRHLREYGGLVLRAGMLDCAIGHEGTAQLAAQIMGVRPEELRCVRKQIVLQPDTPAFIVTLGFRPPEGKVYTGQELQELYRQGKVTIWLAWLERIHRPGQQEEYTVEEVA